MSLQTDFERIKEFDDSVTDMLHRNSYSEEQSNKIIRLIHINNYLQILYSFGTDTLNLLMEYFLYVEEYNQCARIRDCVNNYNKDTGNQITLNV